MTSVAFDSSIYARFCVEAVELCTHWRMPSTFHWMCSCSLQHAIGTTEARAGTLLRQFFYSLCSHKNQDDRLVTAHEAYWQTDISQQVGKVKVKVNKIKITFLVNNPQYCPFRKFAIAPVNTHSSV